MLRIPMPRGPAAYYADRQAYLRDLRERAEAIEETKKLLKRFEAEYALLRVIPTNAWEITL